MLREHSLRKQEDAEAQLLRRLLPMVGEQAEMFTSPVLALVSLLVVSRLLILVAFQLLLLLLVTRLPILLAFQLLSLLRVIRLLILVSLVLVIRLLILVAFQLLLLLVVFQLDPPRILQLPEIQMI
jgi:hypothetical protein